MGLPDADQAALAALIAAIGEDGLDRVIMALATGGAPSQYSRRLSLLRQMAAEMLKQNPHAAFIGCNWKKGATPVALMVAETAEGRKLGLPNTIQKWLTREWDKHGRRLIQECRAAEIAANSVELRNWQTEFRMAAEKSFSRAGGAVPRWQRHPAS